MAQSKNNIRLQKYKKNRISGMDKYNSALDAGYSWKTAKTKGKQLDEQAKISDVLDRAGLTDKVLGKKLVELIGATDVVLRKIESGELEVVGDKSLYKPNWSARAKGIELAFKLKQHLTPIILDNRNTEIKQINVQVVQINKQVKELESAIPE